MSYDVSLNHCKWCGKECKENFCDVRCEDAYEAIIEAQKESEFYQVIELTEDEVKKGELDPRRQT